MEGENNASLRPPSLESRSKLRGQGTGTRSSSNPTLSKDVMPLEKVSEDEEDDDNSFDHRADMSESLPTVDGGSGNQRSDADGDASKAKKAKTGGKKAGVTLSPKCKISRGKRADCWKDFNIVSVPSKKERGVMETKAKCKFCHRSYAYQPGGATTTLNQHLGKCTQYQNKLAKAKAQAQGRVLDDYRSSLKPATVQAVVCASSWIRGTNDDSNHPLDVAGDDEHEVESIEFPKCMVASN